MLRLRRINRMCSRTVADPANRLLKRTDSEGSSSVAEKKSSAVLLFRSGHMSAICARLGSKGKVGVQRGRKTAGCPSFLPPPRGAARSRRPQTANPSAEVQRKTPRPSGANTLTQFVCPGQPVLKKSAARQERTRLRQFERPAGSVQRKVPPGQGEHANAVRVPRSAGAEKAAAPFGRTACAVRVSRLTLRSYLTILREQSMLSQQQNRRKYEPVHPCTLRSVPRH